MQQLLKSHGLPLVLAAILVIVTVNTVETGRIWYSRNIAAIKWQGVEVITEKVHPGGTLTMEYTTVINKQCPADLRGFIVAPDGSVPVRYPVVSGGYSKPSPEPRKIRVSITVPTESDPGLAPLRSGPHTYRTLATRYCPDGVEEDSHVPDAQFQLEVP